jgi:predicted metal-dependent enzyme (double-stranded beta helix superfamily)
MRFSDEVYVSPTDANAIRDPQWDRAGWVHDWRNHVGERTQAIWSTFTDEQRLALAADAAEDAGNESWE